MSSKSIFDTVRFRYLQSNGIRMRLAEMGGDGPLVLMVHGWPESWYSWRHQMVALAAVGYHVIAPDMPGYGESDCPEDIDEYDVKHLSAHLIAILDDLGAKQAILLSHDFGTIISWTMVLLYPDRFSAFVPTSVPWFGRGPVSPIEIWQQRYREDFYYILYHQEPGVAEAEYDADPSGMLLRMFQSPGAARKEPLITDPKRAAGGMIGRRGEPLGLPTWLTQADFDYYVSQFEKSGFRGGVNYYRNFHRNWVITEELAGARIEIPTLFIAGEFDTVLAGANAETLQAKMSRVIADLRSVELLPGIGHWVQQEAPQEVNRLILGFLESMSPARGNIGIIRPQKRC